MRETSALLTLLAVASIAAMPACAEGQNSSFQNIGGGGGASGDGGDGGDGEGGSSGRTSGQATGPGTGASTTVTTGSGSVSSASASGSVSSSSTGEPPCQDLGPGEPANDEMATAHVLGEQSDDDDEAASINGTLREPDDVDWYVYQGDDTTGHSVDPGRSIVGAGVRICKYIDCNDEDEEDFECPSGTMADTQAGHPGCCWTGSDPVEFGLTCGSSSLNSDNARVFMRVDHVGGPGCEAYTLNYNY
jgi:hypothetical protein